jgi:hypothetical protein
MSNHLAFATVNYFLQQRLNTVVGRDVTGATVTNTRPDGTGPGQLPTIGVNVYLLQAVYNGPITDSFLPAMSADGKFISRGTSAWDLTYMLTFHGDDSKWEPQRLQASVLRHVCANAFLGQDTIRALIAALPPAHALKRSNLADEIEKVKVTPLPANLDDLSKIWSVFFQKPYILTSMFRASVVLLDPDITPETSLPVVAVRSAISQISDMRITEVVPDAVVAQAGSVFELVGQNLLPEGAKYLVNGQEAVLDTANSTASSVKLTLAAGLSAGLGSVQVVNPSPFAGAGHTGSGSNAMPIQLRAVASGAVFSAAAGSVPASVTVSSAPAVALGQSAYLVLNRTTAPGAGRPWSYTFEASPFAAAAAALSFVVTGTEPGAYLYRLRINGVESELQIDLTGPDPVFTGPLVTVV